MRKHTIEEMQCFAQSKGGICLSSKYIECKSNLLWQCSGGHKWEARPDNIVQGKWCPFCSHIKTGNRCRKYTIEDIQKIAQSRGGKCLSKSYINMNTKMKWQCLNNHEWTTVLSSIVRGSWCPHCNKYITEKKCRFIIESLTKQKFPKKHLPSGLELDGLCNNLKMAFEYNGAQHYVHIKMFNRTQDDFERQKQRDILKKKECDDLGIHLIVIPYWVSDSDNNLIKSIRKSLPDRVIVGKVNLKKFYKTIPALEDIKLIALQKGGKILNDEYVNLNSKMHCECSKKHTWFTAASNLKAGRWCPFCAQNIKYTISDMQYLALSKNGKCLSPEYLGANKHLKWECEYGHVWSAIPSSIKNLGTWCPECWNERRSENAE